MANQNQNNQQNGSGQQNGGVLETIGKGIENVMDTLTGNNKNQNNQNQNGQNQPKNQNNNEGARYQTSGQNVSRKGQGDNQQNGSYSSQGSQQQNGKQQFGDANTIRVE